MGLVTGCGGRVGAPSTPPLAASQATLKQNKALATMSSPAPSSYTSLYSFKGGADGAFPSGLIAVNGTLYGTTNDGGTNNNGTVYEVSTSGKERVLYRFKGGADGANPAAGLIVLDGALYGTTTGGGMNESGTVFAVTPSGTERVLYRFKGPPDGAYPDAGLVALNGVFYGTTIGGGAVNNGTVFALTPAGAARVLYSFKGSPDGASPQTALIAVNGALYGATPFGGTSNEGGAGGMLFEISPAGMERVLYLFQGGPDGATPNAGLTAMNGALYGTTGDGGPNGYGTAYEASGTGGKRLLYSFKGCTSDVVVLEHGRPRQVKGCTAVSDGATPFGGLIAENGALYGTTIGGGALGYGAVFAMSPAGSERLLYSFKGSGDGESPNGLIAESGALYGTTRKGGTNNNGTVFKLSP
jgi:uncharacterized repeat protein (TIGR03803 family)